MGNIGAGYDLAIATHGADIEAHEYALFQIPFNEPIREPPPACSPQDEMVLGILRVDAAGL